MRKKKSSAVQSVPPIVPREPPRQGYDESKSILSDWVTVRFSVSDHAWNELQESKEWKDFQALLEQYQEVYVQKEH